MKAKVEPRILVVEDDNNVKPLWDRIIQSVAPRALLRWSATAECAEREIRERIKLGDDFDLIVANVSLPGEKSGIDIWKKYGRGRSLFLFSTVLTYEAFAKLIDQAGGLHARPFVVIKPLNVSHCVDIVAVMLDYTEPIRMQMSY